MVPLVVSNHDGVLEPVHSFCAEELMVSRLYYSVDVQLRVGI